MAQNEEEKTQAAAEKKVAALEAKIAELEAELATARLAAPMPIAERGTVTADHTGAPVTD